MTDNDNEQNGTDQSRRRFLKNSGYAAGGVIGGGVIGSLLGVNFKDESNQKTAPEQTREKFNKALMYFKNKKDLQILTAATERIYPEDDNGPGAKKLDVPYFIDHQLAGAYGNNTNEYMHGPFHKGTKYQGYQTRLNRHEVFSQGIRELEKQSQKDYNKGFTDIEDKERDKILSKFEHNDVDMKGVQSADFFKLLLSATLSGVYADPLYGGNANMDGWKMKEYPGAQMSYIDKIQDKKFDKIKPRSLNQM